MEVGRRGLVLEVEVGVSDFGLPFASGTVFPCPVDEPLTGLRHKGVSFESGVPVRRTAPYQCFDRCKWLSWDWCIQ